MGSPGRELPAVHCHHDTSATYLFIRVAAGRLSLSTVDNNNQHVHAQRFMASSGKYADPLLLWYLPVQISRNEKISNRLFLDGYFTMAEKWIGQ